MLRHYSKIQTRILFFSTLLAVWSTVSFAQSATGFSERFSGVGAAPGSRPGAGYKKDYHFLHSGSLVADKNFYWLTVIDQTPVVQNLLVADQRLQAAHHRRLSALKSHVSDSCTWAASLVSDFRFTPADSLEIANVLQTLYRNNKASFDALVDKHLRPSGYYQRWVALSNEDHPSLAVALQLMDMNDRDEPARFEPMEAGENQAAFRQIQHTNWDKYKYATIVIPGNGPVLTTTPVSPDNKLHCSVAAMRYKKGLAPFIIVSGGYCYPFQGPYCEAAEMKKFLMTRWGIPASAIIIDPHARHTTTNIRNADRLMIRYGIPLTKPSVFVTSKSQTDYAAAASFDERNLRELGYLPYRDKQHTSLHDIVFYPVMESLHMDPYDPLDP